MIINLFTVNSQLLDYVIVVSIIYLLFRILPKLFDGWKNMFTKPPTAVVPTLEPVIPRNDCRCRMYIVIPETFGATRVIRMRSPVNN